MGIIELKDFSYSYPITEKPSLKGISLNVEPGEFLAVVGPNGAGKSTLCYAIAGFLGNYFRGTMEGSLQVLGRELQETGLGEWILDVGLVFQNPFTQLSGSKFTVYEEIAFGLENLGVPREEMRPRIDAVMNLTGIADLKDRSPYALSGGQQQRVALASIFVMSPKVLVLDEPTSQMDPIGTREVFQVIKELSRSGVTIILAEHKVEWVAEFADRVIALSEGEIFLQGKPHDVFTSPELVAVGGNVTRYTTVARRVQQEGLGDPEKPLPITLHEAVRWFGGVQDGH
ncbi:MAG: ABC transporter ATP-binding protein [Anaerolineales bacterium]|nr:ABC transporter ATP-binding protein [Anaerolineales bacterium]